DALCASLDPSRGTAIITEGLINYFDRATVIGMWQRFARALARFPRGLYLSDILLREGHRGPFEVGFSLLLQAFVRGRVHLHFDDPATVTTALADAGFDGALLDPRDYPLANLETAGASRVRIIEAAVRS